MRKKIKAKRYINKNILQAIFSTYAGFTRIRFPIKKPKGKARDLFIRKMLTFTYVKYHLYKLPLVQKLFISLCISLSYIDFSKFKTV